MGNYSFVLETRIVDAIVACGDAKLIPGSNQQKCTILECLDDEEAYTKLNDSILDLILVSDDQSLRKAKEVLGRIFRREFYKCVGESNLQNPTQFSGRKAEDIEEGIQSVSGDSLTKDDFFVEIVSLDVGKKLANPLENLCCYSRGSSDDIKPLAADKASGGHKKPRLVN